MIETKQAAIRCPGSFHGHDCNRKFGDFLEGIYKTLCPRCEKEIYIERRDGVDIKVAVL